MKKIEALISPESISPVRDLLEERHISNFLFSNVIARSTTGVHQQVYRGHAYDVEFEAEVKLEAVVQDEQATDTAYAILKAAGGPGVSYKPRVLLAPVHQVIFQLEEVGVEPGPPVGGLKRPVEAAVLPGKPVVTSVDRPRAFRPALSALARMRRFLFAQAAEDSANESSRLASTTAADRRRRRAWLPSLRPAHR